VLTRTAGIGKNACERTDTFERTDVCVMLTHAARTRMDGGSDTDTIVRNTHWSISAPSAPPR